MGLPSNFVKMIPQLDGLIRFHHLHRDIRFPVNLDKIIKNFNIEVEMKPFNSNVMDGFCRTGNKRGIGRKIVINSNKQVEVRRQARAHEFYHLFAHEKEKTYYSIIGHEDLILEREANYGAAYLLVPLNCIGLVLANQWGTANFPELAERLDVPVGLVAKRYEIYLKMKEHRKVKDPSQLFFEFDL